MLGSAASSGCPLSKHQAIQMMIADMGTLVEASRLMVYRAAALRDSGKRFSQESAMAKLFASEACCKVTDMAVQIHGGYGYSKSYPVERYYRDARVTRIYEGSSEVHRMVIARGGHGEEMMGLHIVVCIKSVILAAPEEQVVRTEDSTELNPFDRPVLGGGPSSQGTSRGHGNRRFDGPRGEFVGPFRGQGIRGGS